MQISELTPINRDEIFNHKSFSLEKEKNKQKSLVNSGSSSINSRKDPRQRGNFLLRQELKDYTPACSPICGLIFNTVIVFIFCGIGIPILLFSNEEVTYSIDYTDW